MLLSLRNPHTPVGAPVRGGFSLLEVQMALVLLAIAVLGATGGLSVALQMDRTRDDRDRMLAALNQVFEEIQATPYADVFTTYQAYTYAVEDLGTIQVAIDPAAVDGDPEYPMTLTASWSGRTARDDGVPHQMSFTYLHIDRGR